ncbi:MAG: hypothetical protein ABSG42_05935 [Nitrospirota bacterium]
MKKIMAVLMMSMFCAATMAYADATPAPAEKSATCNPKSPCEPTCVKKKAKKKHKKMSNMTTAGKKSSK